MVSEHASPLATLGGVDAGGQNVHVAALAVEMARRGAQVTVHTRRDAPGLPERVEMAPGVIVHHVDAGPAEAVSKDDLLPYMDEFADRLQAVWRRERPHVVHAHFWMSGHAALRAAEALGIPVVQTFHALGVVKRRYQGDQDTSPEERFAIERDILRRADEIVATCSDEVFELARMGVPRQKISVAPCGVDASMFDPDGPKARRTARQRVVSVGRLVPRKGFADLIDALPAVPDTELLIVGGPTGRGLDDDPEARRLRELAGRNGVADRVILTGQVARRDMPALLRSADVVACVPWYEPFGIVPLEAMACGVPVLASAVGGLTDTVVDGITGVLVPPRRIRTIAQALRRLLADSAQRMTLGAAGCDRARSRYTWDRVALDTERAYLRCAEGDQRSVLDSAVGSWQ
jgi:D-inositol-3-phosphate glycosyltransferase